MLRRQQELYEGKKQNRPKGQKPNYREGKSQNRSESQKND
jgi:hypothetical protein